MELVARLRLSHVPQEVRRVKKLFRRCVRQRFAPCEGTVQAIECAVVLRQGTAHAVKGSCASCRRKLRSGSIGQRTRSDTVGLKNAQAVKRVCAYRLGGILFTVISAPLDRSFLYIGRVRASKYVLFFETIQLRSDLDAGKVIYMTGSTTFACIEPCAGHGGDRNLRLLCRSF